MLRRLGYSAEQIEFAGEDAANYQGVGNPHRHASLQPAERVLDVGSGLGVDAFVASMAVGPRGRVVGVELAREQAEHANRRAEARGLSPRVTFVAADAERIGSSQSGLVDVRVDDSDADMAFEIEWPEVD